MYLLLSCPCCRQPNLSMYETKMCVSRAGWCFATPSVLTPLEPSYKLCCSYKLAFPAASLGAKNSGIVDAAQQQPPKISDGRMPVSLGNIFFGRQVSPERVLGFLCLPSKPEH